MFRQYPPSTSTTPKTVFYRTLSEEELLAEANPVSHGGAREVVWEFAYPTINGEIMNPAIASFQAFLLSLNQSHEALRDFYRGYHIRSHQYVNQAEINDKALLEKSISLDIANTVKECKGYGNDPAIKQQLADWIISRGGQNHNTFIQDMVQHGHFTGDEYDCTDSNMQSAIKSNWVINQAGKLELQYSVWVNNLNFKTTDPNLSPIMSIVRDKDSIRVVEQNAEILDNKNKDKLTPLMRIDAKIQLEIRDGHVVSVMKCLLVTGYVKELSIHVEKVIKSGDIRSKKIYELLSQLELKLIKFSDQKNLVVCQQLADIKALVEQSKFGEDMNKIALAFEMVKGIVATIEYQHEQAQSDSFFPVLSKLKDMVFTDNVLEAFKEIQSSLQILQSFNKTSGRHYPVTPEGCVDAAFVAKWCEDQQRLVREPEASLNDFRQNYSLCGHRFRQTTPVDEVRAAARDLVSRVHTASEQDKDALYQWLLAKGGRVNNSIIGTLFRNNEIAIELPHNLRGRRGIQCLPRNFRIANADWNVDQNGNLTLDYLVYIPRLSVFQGAVTKPLGCIAIEENRFQNTLIYVPENDIPQDPKFLPMMRVAAKITLQVKEGVVTPVVTGLDLESYSRNLKLTPAPEARNNLGRPQFK